MYGASLLTLDAGTDNKWDIFPIAGEPGMYSFLN